MTSAKSPVVYGLIAKRAELAGRIETAQSELRRLVIDLDNLDATIRLFVPDIDLDEIRPRPLPVYEIALLFMASRSLATDDKPLLRVFQKRVDACLRNYRSKGIVRALDGPGARSCGRSCASSVDSTYLT